MLTYTVTTLKNKWNFTFDEAVTNIIKTEWGQEYDFEQLLEHAIVHILRHRRQIERFLIKIKEAANDKTMPPDDIIFLTPLALNKN